MLLLAIRTFISFFRNVFSLVLLGLAEEIRVKFNKMVEPPPVKAPKPLPRPDDLPRKKRGGRR